MSRAYVSEVTAIQILLGSTFAFFTVVTSVTIFSYTLLFVRVVVSLEAVPPEIRAAARKASTVFRY